MKVTNNAMIKVSELHKYSANQVQEANNKNDPAKADGRPNSMDKHAKSKHLKTNNEFFVPGQNGIVNGVNGGTTSNNHSKSTSVAAAKKHFGNTRATEEVKEQIVNKNEKVRV
jgi:hypothetical protein